MPTAQQLEWVQLSDFTPGIADEPGVSYPPGTAERTNTYRCICNHAGALIPMPKQDFTKAGTHFGTPSSDYIINGLYVAGPLLPVTGSSDANGRYHEFWLGVEYLDGTNRKMKLQRIRQAEATPTTDTIKDLSVADTRVSNNGWGMTFGQTRTNKTTPGNPGYPVVAFAWAGINLNSQFISVYPDDTTPTADTEYDISTTYRGMIVCHQGRIVIRLDTGYDHGSNLQYSNLEDLYWTAVNDPTAANLSTKSYFSPEQPNGYTVMESMSANELFGLKESGGVTIIGDLDNPTVTNLPMVPGTSIRHVPARTPIGLVYLSQSGVWAWNHGDTAQLISPNMADDFWQVTPETLSASQYQLESFGDWIFLPNNWVYDINTKSWWLIENQSTVKIRMWTRFRQFIYGVPSTYTNAADTAIYGWRRDQNATSYSWQSQPLWASIERELEVRELILVAKGYGTVQVDLTALDGSTSSVTFNLANVTYPQRKRENIAVKGQYIKVRFTVTGTSGDAPTIYSLGIGHRPSVRTIHN